MSFLHSSSIEVRQSGASAAIGRRLGWLVVAICVSAATAGSARAQMPAVPAAAKAAGAAGPVDLNTASEAALVDLPGVGPATAKAIVAGRPYSSVDDLAKVKGIGPAKLAALRGHVTVAGAKAAAAAPSTPPAATPPAASAPKMPAMPAAPPPAPPPPVAIPSKPAAGTPAAATSRPSAAAAAKLAVGEKININTASAADLAKLPGIGPAKAEKIIAGRPYAKPEDIMKVSGIKAGVFGKLKDSITVQ